MIDKKNIKFRFDVGTFLIFENRSGHSFFSLKNDDFQDIGIITNLLYAAMFRADDKVTIDDVHNLTIKELEEVVKSFMLAMESTMNQNKENTLFKFNVQEGDKK